MADYTAKITLNIPITARTEEKAQERADELAEILVSGKWPTFRKPWLGDTLDGETLVEKDE